MTINDPQSESSYKLANPNIHAVPVGEFGGSDNSRILPRQISTGALRGTQNVGYGDVKIDGSSNQIVIGNTVNSLGQKSQTVIGRLSTNAQDKSFGVKVVDSTGTTVQFGLMKDGTPGMEIYDSSGFVLFKLTGKTWYWFDKIYNTNTMQAGLLPDSSYGWVAVPPANNVTDAFST